MRYISFHNADGDGTLAKTVLAGCYKFSLATLLRPNGATMTSIIETDIDMSEFITILKSKQTHAFDCAWEISDGLSPCLTSAMGMGGGMTPMITDATVKQVKTTEFMEQTRGHKVELPPELQGKKFRIRKLTPKECFRLMGVDDADIDKMQSAGISNSNLYKLAGNSIVVDVLYYIFKNALIDTEAPREKGMQLTLF